MIKNNNRFNQPIFWIVASFIVGGAIYLLSFDWTSLFSNGSANYWMWRKQSVLLTGCVAWVFMTLCMLIAIRPKFLDRWLDGLDKAYFLHKWAGIYAVVLSLVHWLSYKAGHWMVTLGWIAPKVRPEGIVRSEPASWLVLGKNSGEIGLYLFVGFIAIAMVPKIPYRIFQKLHKFIAIIYLVLAYHSMVMIPESWWATAAPYLLAVLTLVGTFCAVLTLTKTFNLSSRYRAKIKNLQQNSAGMIHMQLDIEPGKTFNHYPGQFAFIDFGPQHGAHPFTIASSNPQLLEFVIKPLGDFTRKIADLIKPEQIVNIEGPYGQFTFHSNEVNQVWVGAGVGVTPFISRLEFLAANGGSRKPTQFWYCVKTEEEGLFPTNLAVLCEKANVTLHKIIGEHKQRLNASMVAITLEESGRALNESSVWFCGPSSFAQSLKEGLEPLGLHKRSFHAELFNFR